MDLLPLIPTGASRVPGISGPNQGLIWTYRLWSPPGLHLDLVTLVPPGPLLDLVTLSNMDLTWIWCIWSSVWPHLDLVSLVPTLT